MPARLMKVFIAFSETRNPMPAGLETLCQLDYKPDGGAIGRGVFLQLGAKGEGDDMVVMFGVAGVESARMIRYA